MRLLTFAIILSFFHVLAPTNTNIHSVESDQDSVSQTMDTFAHERQEISAFTLEIKENGNSLGTYELGPESTNYTFDEVSIEIIEHTQHNQNGTTNEPIQPAFIIKVEKEGLEEWSVVGEGFHLTGSDPLFDIILKEIVYEDDLEI